MLNLGLNLLDDSCQTCSPILPLKCFYCTNVLILFLKISEVTSSHHQAVHEMEEHHIEEVSEIQQQHQEHMEELNRQHDEDKKQLREEMQSKKQELQVRYLYLHHCYGI